MFVKDVQYNRFMKFLRRLFLCILIILFLGAGFLTGSGYLCYRESVNEKSILSAVEPYVKDPEFVSFYDIDTDFVNAVVAVEDKRFFSRHGFDWVALIRAIVNNLEAGRAVEGASTITQQTAKNLYYLGKPRGFREKIAEVFIMFEMESHFSKREIFAIYANMNYYGDGYWGIGQASRGYFHKDPSDLTIAQAAMLAGIPNAPGRYQWSTGFDLAKKRQEKVLSRMYEDGMISEKSYQDAMAEKMR